MNFVEGIHKLSYLLTYTQVHNYPFLITFWYNFVSVYYIPGNNQFSPQYITIAADISVMEAKSSAVRGLRSCWVEDDDINIDVWMLQALA